ncbi:MAG: thiamine-phosphate kinase [bacterium]
MSTGEFELIAKFIERLPAPGPEVLVASGDDAAVADHDGPVVVSVDAAVEGVHFERPAFSSEAIGRKALASAVSDLAAMAATPRHGYVVVGVPPEEPDSNLLELADGIGSVATAERMAIIGGDLVRSPVLMVSVTAIGAEADGTPLVTRAGAQPGDAVVVTGEIGGAAAGLRLLGTGTGRDSDGSLIARQLSPTPRVVAGQALARAGASAMIDLSDGLVQDADHLARASGVRIEMEVESVPFQPGAVETLSEDLREGRISAASGGEDYELLACLPENRIQVAQAEIEGECGLTRIGTVVEGEQAVLLDDSGAVLPVGGFDHLTER